MHTVAIDFETYLIGEPDIIPKPVCLSWYDGENEGICVGMTEMHEFLQKILTDSTYYIVAHNMKFEALVIYEHFPLLREQLLSKLRLNHLICTKICEKLINNIRKKQTFSQSLAALVQQYFETDISEDKKNPDAWRLRYSELDGKVLSKWPAEAVKYALDDSIWAYRIWGIQKQLSPDYGLSVRSEVMLGLMAHIGILIDQDRVNLLEKEVKAILEPRYAQLVEAGLCSPPLGKLKPKKNMNEFREYCRSQFKNLEYTAKGTISTSRESLTRYAAEKQDDNLEAFLEISNYEKVETAFINNLKEANPYMRTEYNAVVSTGRTSSYKSKLYPTVNIQQMPRQVKGVTYDVRNCFRARPGHKLVSIDYAGLELAATAQQLFNFYGCSKMLNTLNSGTEPTDMHSQFAARIMSLKTHTKVTYDTFIEHKKEKEYAKYRQLAKPINLGFPGGIGYDTMRTLLFQSGIVPQLEVIKEAKNKDELFGYWRILSKEYNNLRIRQIGPKKFQLVVDELVQLKKELFELYPELGKFLNEGHKAFLTGETRWVKDDFGTWEEEEMYAYEVSGFKRNWCTYTALCNGFLMQSPSAIGAKTMVCDVMERYLTHKSVNILAFIHDEILFEVLDNGQKYGTIEDIAYQMIESMQSVLPDVRITVEASMMDYWSKSGGEYEKVFWQDPISEKKNKG